MRRKKMKQPKKVTLINSRTGLTIWVRGITYGDLLAAFVAGWEVK
jgi:hypothetical protein